MDVPIVSLKNVRKKLRGVSVRLAVFAGVTVIGLHSVSATDRTVKFDFDGDGKTDIAVYRPGIWTISERGRSFFYYLSSSTGQIVARPWGLGGDRPAPADYDNDGVTDLAVFRSWEPELKFPWEASDYWIEYSTGGYSVTYHKGYGGIASRNFVGGPEADLAVFTFRTDESDPNEPCSIYGVLIKDGENLVQKDVMNACENAPFERTPAFGDYNNDGVSDVAVHIRAIGGQRNSRFDVWTSPMAGGYTEPDIVDYLNVDFPIPGDYDGDGKTDIAGGQFVNGRLVWRAKHSSDGQVRETVFGIDGDKPVPGDYDGDGRCDIAVFRPSSATWYILRSLDENWWVFRLGVESDIPINQPNAF